jgi:uncharacterized protein (TIGR00730 family)
LSTDHGVVDLAQGIAVFGSSEAEPGGALYHQAHDVGLRLARAGYVVVTGGYGGVMEAASRGALEAGGRTLGITVADFVSKTPNGYLSEVQCAADLHQRTARLISVARGFVVLEGKSGTLAELALVWALDRAGCLGERPVVVLGDSYRELIGQLVRLRILDAAQLRSTRLADSPRQAVELLVSRLQKVGER